MTETARLALSLGLGLLVGFQREWAAKRLAAIRTFPLVAMLGIMVAISAATYFATRGKLERVELDHAPSDLRAAVAFGLLDAAVLP